MRTEKTEVTKACAAFGKQIDAFVEQMAAAKADPSLLFEILPESINSRLGLVQRIAARTCALATQGSRFIANARAEYRSSDVKA